MKGWGKETGWEGEGKREGEVKREGKWVGKDRTKVDGEEREN